MSNDKVKRLMQSQLIAYYGDDTTQMERILLLPGWELEQEVKKALNIKSDYCYFYRGE